MMEQVRWLSASYLPKVGEGDTARTALPSYPHRYQTKQAPVQAGKQVVGLTRSTLGLPHDWGNNLEGSQETFETAGKSTR